MSSNVRLPRLPRLVCAACRIEGHIVLGIRHWDRFMSTAVDGLIATGKLSKPLGDAEQGFVDQFGGFYNRTEALELVERSGAQIDYERNGSETELFSEGIY